MSVSPQEMLQQLKQDQPPDAVLAELKSKPEDLTFANRVENSVTDLMKKIAESQTPQGMAKRRIKQRGKGLAAAKGSVEVGQDFMQLGSSLLEKANILPEGFTSAYTKRTEADRAVFDKAFKEEFGEDVTFKMSEIGGRMVPTILISRGMSAAGPAIASPTAQVVSGGVQGGVFGASEWIPSNDEQSRLMNAITGAGFGAGFSMLMNFAPAIKNTIKRAIGIGKPTAISKEGVKLAKQTGVDLDVADITGTAAAKQIKQIAAGTLKGADKAIAAGNKKIGQTLDFWNKTLKSITKSQKRFGPELNKAFTKTMGSSESGRGLIGVRARAAKSDFAAVDKAAKGEIPLKNFFKQADTIVADAKKRGASATDRRIAAGLLRQIKGFKGKANANELQKFLSDFGDASKGTRTLWKDLDAANHTRPAKQLFAALNRDLDDAVKAGGSGANELKLARDNYRTLSKEIDKVRDSAISKILGTKQTPTATQIEEGFKRMDPEQIKDVMKILGKSDVALKQKAQRFWIERHLDKAMEPAEAGLPVFSPEKMLDLTKGDNFKKFKAIFDDQVNRKQVETGLKVIQRIMGTKTASEHKSFKTLITSGAGVAASMDKTFQARLLSEIFTPRAMAKFATSKQAVDSFTRLSKGRNTREVAAALISLNNIRKEEEDGD